LFILVLFLFMHFYFPNGEHSRCDFVVFPLVVRKLDTIFS